MVKRKKEDKQESFCSYLQNQIRQSAVKEVIENPWKREWANNTEVQATANALGVSIEIINDSERIPSSTVIPHGIESITRHQRVFLGYIGNVHYVEQSFKNHLL